MNETRTISPGVDEQFRRLADPADVLDPVGVGEAEVAVEPVADIVAVEQVGVPALEMQPLLDQVGDRRLAGAGETGEPENARPLALEVGARVLVHVERLPMDVGCPAQAVADHAGGDRRIGEAVDQDERAGRAVVVIDVEGDRLRQRQVAEADIVESERLGRERLEALDVDMVLEVAHRRADRARAAS